MKSWKNYVAKLGTEVRARTERVMRIASKSLNEVTRVITKWWYGKTPTGKSSESSARRKSSSDSSSGEL